MKIDDKKYNELMTGVRRLQIESRDTDWIIFGLQNDLKRIETELHERIDRLSEPPKNKTHTVRVHFEKLKRDGDSTSFWVDTGRPTVVLYRFSASDECDLIQEAIGRLFGSNVDSTNVSYTSALASDEYDCLVELRFGGRMRFRAKIEYGRL